MDKPGKILLIGGIGSGKTSLKQYLNREELIYRKTQVLEYSNLFVDCPGEYLEIPRYYHVLINSSLDVAAICALQDATKTRSFYPPNFLKVFSKPLIGVVTKTDISGVDSERARSFLSLAGVSNPVYPISVLSGSGVSALRECLASFWMDYKDRAADGGLL